MAKYRTIAKAYKEVVKLDSETSLSEYVIRQLAKEGKISQIQSGNKILVEVESLIEFLNGADFEPQIIKLDEKGEK